MSARSKRRAATFIARTSAPAPLDALAGPAARRRFDRLDALRGTAIVWMAAFHFSFDLNYFRVIHQDFYRSPVWTVQRACIVTLFMLCVGAGQGIAAAQGQSLSRFWKRVAQIAGCALLVSIGSWAMFPASFISFGVLHAIAVLLIVMRLSHRARRWLWPLAVLGRWSLSFYMLHQPVLIGLLWLATTLPR